MHSSVKNLVGYSNAKFNYLKTYNFHLDFVLKGSRKGIYLPSSDFSFYCSSS